MAKRPAPSLLEYMAAVGTITQTWNYLEHQMGVIAWFLTKDPEAAHVFTARMRNAELCTAILELSEMREKRPRVRRAISFLVEVFNILRENRNVLVHSDIYSINEGEKPRWRRRSKSKPRSIIVAEADYDDLQELVRDLTRAHAFADKLANYLEPEGYFFKSGKGRLFAGQPLPRRFPKPRRMLQPHPSR